MGIMSGLVLYVVIWFMTFFVALPLRLKTQGEDGEVVPGTHDGAPAVHQLRKKAIITTFVALAIWVVAAGIILSGVITLRDIDVFNRMAPATG